MFDEIRYELNDVEIDRNWNITSMLKNYVLKTYDTFDCAKHWMEF